MPGLRLNYSTGQWDKIGRDAHAWAEVYFEESGWVPFDGSPRPEVLAPGSVRGGQLAGVRYLFENSFGDDLLRAMVIAPSRLSSGIKTAFSGAIGIAIAVVIGAAAVAMVWFGARLLRKARKPDSSGWSYDRLAGANRDEMLTVFSKVERFLQKKGITKRERGQTLREYARSAEEQTPGVLEHLNWFVRASTAAAYDPQDFSSGTVEEARVRFAFLKHALLAGRPATSR